MTKIRIILFTACSFNSSSEDFQIENIINYAIYEYIVQFSAKSLFIIFCIKNSKLINYNRTWKIGEEYTDTCVYICLFIR